MFLNMEALVPVWRWHGGLSADTLSSLLIGASRCGFEGSMGASACCSGMAAAERTWAVVEVKELPAQVAMIHYGKRWCRLGGSNT